MMLWFDRNPYIIDGVARLALFIMERPVNARALANLEMAVIRRFFDQHQLACPDLHAYDARTIFNEVSYGILWPVQGGWQHLGVTDSQSAFNMDHFEQVELIGRQNQTIYPTRIPTVECY